MAARFTIQELLEATGGTLYAPSDFGDPVVDGLTIDTRTLLPGMAYVAIRGGTFDGHRFIPDAMEKGPTTAGAQLYSCGLRQHIFRLRT